jgi:outer membrane receptor protein involved in Fe transport
VNFSAREDLWSNFQAHSVRIPVVGNETNLQYPRRGENSFDPRLTMSYRAGDHVVLYAAGYRSFRAPTLNELYRSFRVGNVQTLANAFLVAEHYAGAEGGLRATLLHGRLSLHGNLFWGYVTDPVANVTLSTTPTLITRQRQNLGEDRSRGVQVGADWQITSRIALSADYQFLDSTVINFPANRSLEGNMIPLVPRNQCTFQGTWLAPARFFVGIQGRTASNEFDDDQNLLPLGSYFVLSATVSHPLPKGFNIFLAGENLGNEQYEIARTPVVNLGQPILVRIGLRWQLPK